MSEELPETGLAPIKFRAVTRKMYEVPLIRAETVDDVLGDTPSSKIAQASPLSLLYSTM